MRVIIAMWGCVFFFLVRMPVKAYPLFLLILFLKPMRAVVGYGAREKATKKLAGAFFSSRKMQNLEPLGEHK